MFALKAPLRDRKKEKMVASDVLGEKVISIAWSLVGTTCWNALASLQSIMVARFSLGLNTMLPAGGGNVDRHNSASISGKVSGVAKSCKCN